MKTPGLNYPLLALTPPRPGAEVSVVSAGPGAASDAPTRADRAEVESPWARFAQTSAGAGAEPVPSDIRGLVDYRRRRREAAAEGQRLPKLDLGRLTGDAAAPAPVAALMRAVDAVLPQVMKAEKLTLSELFQLDHPTPRGVANRWQKTLAGAGAITAGYVAWELAKQVTGLGDVAVVAGAALAGQKLAGVLSYLMHDLIDEFDAFPESFEFQVHHEDPGELGRWEAANTVGNIGRIAAPALGLLAALEPTLGIGSAALAFVGSLYLSPLFHKWSHLPSLPKEASGFERLQRRVIDLAQQAGLIVDKHTHLEHHAGRRAGRMEREPKLPHTASFDVTSGSLLGSVNEVMNDLDVSQRLKRAIYVVSKKLGSEGVEPHSWTEHPELRARWGGDGTAAERKAAALEVRSHAAERRIAGAKAELAASELLLQTGQTASGEAATEAQRTMAAAQVKSLPASIAKMELDLAALKDGTLAR